MLSILAIAAARCDPMARAFGSLKLAPSVFAVPVAGVGVDGTFAAAAELGGAATGAAGGAGVAPDEAGVDGTFAGVDGEAAVAAGAALGCSSIKTLLTTHGTSIEYLLDHAYYESLLFDFVRLYCILILQDLTCGTC